MNDADRRVMNFAFRLWEFYSIPHRDDRGMTQNRDVSWTYDRLQDFLAEERLLETMY